MKSGPKWWRMKPEISVVMSVFNGGRFLADAVRSVRDQTFGDFEFLIVDDGSTDGSARVLREHAAADRRITILENRANLGLTRSLNLALDRAAGRFVARHDADDVSMPHRFQVQLDALARNPAAGFVGSSVTAIDGRGVLGATERAPVDDTLIRWQMLFRNVFKHGAVMMRRRTLETHRLRYDEEMVYAQDYDLWSRMLRISDGLNVGQPLVWYRNHDRRITRAHADAQARFATRVSRENLKRIGMRLTEEETARLCRWMQCPPRRMTAGEMAFCRRFFTVLSRFRESRPGLDPGKVRRIGSRMTRHLLSAVSFRQIPALLASGLLGTLWRHDGPAVLREAGRRLRRAALNLPGKGVRAPAVHPVSDR